MNKMLLLLMGLFGFGMGVFGQVGQSRIIFSDPVGFVRITVPRGGITLASCPFDSVYNLPTIGEMLWGDLPNGTAVWIWNNVENRYEIETYRIKRGQGGWSPNRALLERGGGFWIRIPANAPSNSYSVYVMGVAPSATNTPMRIDSGFNLLGYPYPVSIAWTNTLMANSGRNMDTLLTYGPAGYAINICRKLGVNGAAKWSNCNQIIGVAEGFWYMRSKISTIVNEPKPYAWP
jgi:hypothetical protein